MAITKQQKAELISDFQTIAKDSSSIVFVSFKGMSVNDTIKMRKQFFKENIGYRVTKKTLLKRALGEVSPCYRKIFSVCSSYHCTGRGN